MLDFFAALGVLLQPWSMLFIFIGVLVGVIVGAIPGLTGVMAISLVLPLSYYMETTNALILMVAIYVGSISGGLISATLLRMPGSPANIVTIFDAYPMAKKGQPGRALGLGIWASFAGGIISWIFLATMAPWLARFALRFGHFEYASLILMALVLIAAVTEGTFVKGLISGVLGILVALPGLDPVSAQVRLTWGVDNAMGGLGLLPVLIGVFAVSQILLDVKLDRLVTDVASDTKGILLSVSDFGKQALNTLRSSVIGTWIGILPGIGASVSSLVSYSMARSFSKTPEKYGTGHDSGIVASEAANNANVGGALIPLISMGIPGSAADAILLGAFLIHNLVPGPLLFKTSPHIVWAIIAAFLISNFVMFAMMIAGAKFFAKIMVVPQHYLYPAILVFCFIGAYAENNRMFDVWVMLGAGIGGYFIQRCGVPLGPFVIGFVLAPLAEASFRSALMTSGGSYVPFVTRPISLFFIIVAIATLLFVLYRERQMHVWRRSSQHAFPPEP